MYFKVKWLDKSDDWILNEPSATTTTTTLNERLIIASPNLPFLLVYRLVGHLPNLYESVDPNPRSK